MGEVQNFHFRHVKFEVCIVYQNGDVFSAVGHMSLDTGEGCGLEIEFW